MQERQSRALQVRDGVLRAETHLGLVGTKVPVSVGETLETDRELDVALWVAGAASEREALLREHRGGRETTHRADDVLDLEVGELGLEAELLDDARKLARARRESSSDLAPVTTTLPDAKTSAVVLGSRIRMMTAAKRCRWSREVRAGAEEGGSRALVSPASRDASAVSTRARIGTHLGVVLGVARMERDRLEVELALEVDGRDNVPFAAAKGTERVNKGCSRLTRYVHTTLPA